MCWCVETEFQANTLTFPRYKHFFYLYKKKSKVLCLFGFLLLLYLYFYTRLIWLFPSLIWKIIHFSFTFRNQSVSFQLKSDITLLIPKIPPFILQMQIEMFLHLDLFRELQDIQIWLAVKHKSKWQIVPQKLGYFAFYIRSVPKTGLLVLKPHLWEHITVRSIIE